MRLPPCPLFIVLVPLKCPSRNLQFPYRVPFSQGENALVPLPFQKRSVGLQVCVRVHKGRYLSQVHYHLLLSNTV